MQDGERKYFVDNVDVKDRKLEDLEEKNIALTKQVTSLQKQLQKVRLSLNFVRSPTITPSPLCPPAPLNPSSGGVQCQEQLASAVAEADTLRREAPPAEQPPTAGAASEEAEALTERVHAAEQQAVEAVERAARLSAALDQEKSRCEALVGERNALRNKAESLSREMARITKTGLTVEDVEDLLAKNVERQVMHTGQSRRLFRPGH
jgi:predicted  nucleic acid-binding Zn-ribbon protein